MTEKVTTPVEFHLMDLIQTAFEIVQELADDEPITHSDEEGLQRWCGHCQAVSPSKVEDHEPYCLWRQAEELTAKLDQEIEVES